MSWGTASRPEAPKPRPPPAIDTGAACLATLDRLHLVYQPLQLDPGPGGCVIDTPVRVTVDAIPWGRPGTVSCAMAERLFAWESEQVQPLAQQILGRAVVQLEHFGAYSCRAETGSRHRPSQHGYGRAIDVSGFALADGERISVERDWTDRGPRGQFLRTLAVGSCRYFSVVLSPNFNAQHRNHLHLDVGPDRLCGV